jgi:hypothetical protein
MESTMTNLEHALTVVKTAGYRVSKPRAPKPTKPTLGLNAIGKPYGASFDPNYKMKYHTPSISNRKGNVSSIPGISPERWVAMCAQARKEAIAAGRITL